MTLNVDATRKGFVGEIRFSSPPHNFASVEMVTRIADALEQFDRDPQVRCGLLIADGSSFCAGADLFGDKTLQGDSGIDQIRALYGQALRIFRRRKPLVAAVGGPAIGAGLGLALSADFRVASTAARFSANFVRLGFHPGFGITATLPRAVGHINAGWMLLSGERIKADAALQWGLVNRLTSAEALASAGCELAEAISANAPLALQAVRATWAEGEAETVAAAMDREIAQQALLRKTADYAEGVDAAFSRREPVFQGR